MENINVLLTAGICASTIIGVGGALATIILQFTNVTPHGLITSLLIYIVIVLLFVVGVWREIR